MARPQLPNAPLVEVIAELRFHGDLRLYQGWGELQADLKAEFPRLLVPAGESGKPPLLQPLKLTSADDSSGVLLAVNTIAYTCAVYPGFDAFRASVDRVTSAFAKRCPAVTPSRFGLRYTNVLPLDFPAPVVAGQVSPCLRAAVGGIPMLREKPSEPPLLVIAMREGGLTLRVSVLPPVAVLGAQQIQVQPNVRGVVLDLDAGRTEGLTQAAFDAFLGEAHELIERAFFDLITDEYHAYLKGEA